MTQLTERIAALEAKLKSLKSRQQKDDSRKRTLDSRRTRKADTRRKILIGAIVLARVDQGRLEKTDVTAGSIKHSHGPRTASCSGCRECLLLSKR